MKDKDMEKWRATRERGMLSYLLTQGVLAWGVPMFIVMSFIVNRPFADGITIGKIFLHGGIWLVAGLFFGAATWTIFEKMYRRELEKRSEQ